MRLFPYRVILSVLAVLLIFYGCAVNSQVTGGSDDKITYLKDAPEITVVYYPPLKSFMVMDSSSPISGLMSSLLFSADEGAIGNSITYSDARINGEKISKELDLEDPVVQLKKEFLNKLEMNLGIHHFKPIDEITREESIQSLQKEFKKGTVLDFKTMNWGVITAINFKDKVDYRGRSRLINLESGKIVWQGECHFQGPETSLESLKQEHGTLLKSTLNEAVIQCSHQLFDFLSKGNERHR